MRTAPRPVRHPSAARVLLSLPWLWTCAMAAPGVAAGENEALAAARAVPSPVQRSPIAQAPAGLSAADWRSLRAVHAIAQQAYLKAGNSGASDVFGSAVAISGDTVVIGAPSEASSSTGVNSVPNEAAPDAGAAYVYVRSGAGWTQQAYLKASNTEMGDGFGRAVAVSGDTVVIGADLEDSSSTGVNSTPNEAAANAGAAYIFVRNGATWSQQAYVKASNTAAGEVFGWSVAASGDTVVIGAPWEGRSGGGLNFAPGAAYVFVRSGATWTQQAYLRGDNSGPGDWSGWSVAVSGDTVVVGAPQEDSSTTGVNGTPNEASGNSGAAYVYVRSGMSWTQQAFVKASNTGTSDLFGESVAISGDTMAIGARFEDSGTTGVDSTPNEAAFNAGAAYVYLRTGTTWAQQAYLKASNTERQDEFGSSVAVSGDGVVVGTIYEASSSTGVNSTPDEAAPFAGAAYLYRRSGASWAQQAYLKPLNTGTGDYFGSAVAASGDSVVIGARLEDSSTTGVNSTPNEAAPDAGAVYVFAQDDALFGNGFE